MNAPGDHQRLHAISPLLLEAGGRLALRFQAELAGKTTILRESVERKVATAVEPGRDVCLQISNQFESLMQALLPRVQSEINAKFLEKIGPSNSTTLGKTTIFSMGALSLVDDWQMQEELAIADAGKMLRDACQDGFVLLSQAFAQLLNRTALAEAENPCLPRLFCRGLMEAIGGLRLAPEAKLEFFEILRPLLPEVLSATYESTLAYLSERGVTVSSDRRYSGPTIQRQKASPKAANLGETPTAPLGGEVGNGGDLASILSRVLQAQGNAASQDPLRQNRLMGMQALWSRLNDYQRAKNASDGGAGDVPVIEASDVQGMHPSAMDLLSALESQMRFQDDASKVVDLARNPEDTLVENPDSFFSGRLENVVRRSKERLNEALAPIDQVAAEIVAVMFDKFFEDERLSDSLKALVARLQFPVLKAALTEPAFFAEADHPVRRLMNDLADFGIAFPEDTEHRSTRWQAIYWIVRELTESFGSDVSAVLNATEKLAELREQAEAEAAQRDAQICELVQSEKEQDAQNAARTVISTNVARYDCPAGLVQMIEAVWVPLLVKDYLEAGVSNPFWKRDLKILLDLLESTRAIASVAQRKQFVSGLKALLGNVEKCLDRAEVDFAVRESLMQELHLVHAARVRAQVAFDSQATLPKAIPASELASAGGVDNDLSPPAEALTELSITGSVVTNPVEPDQNGLKRGIWIRLHDDSVHRHCRINWVSPRGHMLVLKDYSSNTSFPISRNDLLSRIYKKHAEVLGKLDLICASIESAIVGVTSSPQNESLAPA